MSKILLLAFLAAFIGWIIGKKSTEASKTVETSQKKRPVEQKDVDDLAQCPTCQTWYKSDETCPNCS